jgi:hypothetical protein
MATTKITSPELFDLGSLNTALQLPSGTTAERPASPSTGEWRYNTTTNLIEFYDGADWMNLQGEVIPPTPSENFNTVLWTGNGTGQSITGVGFAPDFVWLKDRDQNAYAHRIFDTSRGVLNVIKPSGQNAQSTDAGSLTSFDSDGFTLGNDNYVNNSGDDFVGWTMKANGGTTVSNGDGDVTSTVQLNSKTNFSIVEFQGTTSENSVGHGLGVKPELIIIKELGFTANWNVYYDVVDGSLDYAHLNLTSAGANSSRTMWTSSVFYWSGNATTDCVAYCFSSVSGYSKIGSYTGNGSTNGPLVETGFEPAFIMIKNVSAIYEWTIYDNKRSPSNPRDNVLYPNNNDAENTGETGDIDFLTNGFQLKATEGSINQNGGNILYMAFASDASAAPTLADSFGLTTYTGNGASGNSITGLSFKPSLLWLKSYAGSVGNFSHQVMDSLRGASSSMSTNNQNNETINTNGLESFDSNGFTVGSAAGGWNYSGTDYVAWAWKANTLPSINTDGAQTALVSANVAAGFSIVQLPDRAGTYTVGHGLDGVPDLIITKQYQGGTGNWLTYNSPIGARNYMNLNVDAGNTVATPGYEYDSVTATTFTNLISGSTYSYIHYCFKSVPGFSKIGSYTGNGSTQSITGVGFQPNWLMIKQTDGSNAWRIFDSARGLSAPQTLFANLDLAEDSESNTVSSFDSDGWTMGSQQGVNDNGDNYIYIAFKENPSPQPAAGNMSFLVIAGGGGGSRYGGGGAGGLRTSYGNTSGGGSASESDITLAAGTYTITVGAGGSGGNRAASSNGANSTVSTITSTGGGNGWSSYSPTVINGGSGGGGNTSNAGGTGTANQGFDGGPAGYGFGSTYNGTGGGGASQAGQASGSTSGTAGNGGNGLAVTITGASVTYAGGGGGSDYQTSAGGTGGTGGGGNGTGWQNGATPETPNGTTGTTNLGGGGGGGMNGGSGVVILRLATSEYSGTTTGSPTVTTDGDYTILKYTGSGTYVHS